MVQYLNLDYLIVYTFLAITLVIGWRAGRGVKDIREYALGNKMYGVAVLVFTFFATNIGGASTLDTASDVFADGIIMPVALLGVGIQILIISILVVPYIKYFKNCLTIGEVMGSLYGRYSQVLTGILGSLYSFCMIGMELFMLGIVCEKLLGIPANMGISIGGLLLTIYSAHGGIKSVTATDVFQFLVLFIVIPLIAALAINKVGGIQEVFIQAPVDRFKLFSHDKFSFHLTLFLMWSVLPLGLISPPIFQRLLIAKDNKQLQQQYFIVAALDPLLQITIMIIGLAGLVLYPHIQAVDVMPHLIKELFPIGLKGFAIAGMLAVVMSTADSYLHTAGLLLVHDVIAPISGKKIFNELRWAKYGTLLIGVISIIIGLKATNVITLSFTAMRIAGPILLFPLLAGIIGIKPDKKTFYGSMVFTIITFSITSLLLPKSHSHLGVPISIVLNAIIFLVIHFIQNGKILMVDRKSHQISIPLVQAGHSSIVERMKHYLPTLSNIQAYSQRRVKQYGAPYILFGVFYAINFTYPYFMWSDVSSSNSNLMLILRFIGALACGLLVAHSKWPKPLLPYLPTFFHFTVLYCLPFTSTIMYLLTQGSTEWLVNIMAIIILLFVLIDWISAIILSSVGITLAFICYHIFVGDLGLSLDFSSKYLIFYQGVFGLLIGLIFARRKQISLNRLATDNQILAASEKEIRQAHFETFIEKVRLIKTLKNADIEKLSNAVKDLKNARNAVKDLKNVKSQLASSVDSVDKNLQGIETSVTAVALALTKIENKAIDYLRLDVKSITIKQLLEQLQQPLHKTTLHYMGKTQHQQIVCDPIQLVKAIKNTIIALPKNEGDSQQKDHYLTLEDTHLTYPLSMVNQTGDYVKKISAIRFIITEQAGNMPELAKSYQAEMGSSALPILSNVRELLLAENQRIIKAHYGYTNVDITKQTDYDYYTYVVPVDLNDIRPADTDAPDKELGVALVRANDQYPGAQKQEKAFLKDVEQKSATSIEKVKEALEIIKIYHGSVSRRSGEPYYLHPLAVAHIVLDWNTEEATIIGALLHDTLEDTPMLAEDIDMVFGPEVVGVVSYVTHFGGFKDSFYRGKLTNSENMMMLLEATDKRALYVKLADRLHNMRTIEGHKTEEKKKTISEETLGFFVPLAKSLGLEKAAKELFDISTRVLNR